MARVVTTVVATAATATTANTSTSAPAATSLHNPARQDPARIALAAAIEAHSKAAEHATAAKAAVSRAEALVTTAHKRVEEAAAALATAREARTTGLVAAAASGTILGADTSLREARLREQEAQDEVEAAQAALPLVKEQLARAEYEVERGQKALLLAAQRVLAGAIEPTVARVVALREELEAARAALHFLHGQCFAWPPSDESKRLLVIIDPLPQRMEGDHPLAAPWHQALTALLHDANAALPEV